MKHRKHTKLTRPDLGEFGRNEWSIIGTVCSDIKTISFEIIDALKYDYHLAYVDADHKSADEFKLTRDNAIDFGATLEYTDKITFHRFDEQRTLTKFQFRQYFNSQDGVIVNGNHFAAKKQIVVIDERKEASLKKKLDRLTNVELFVLTEGQTEIYPFLKEYIPNWQEIPTVQVTDIESIKNYIKKDLEDNKPELYALVLAGGKSQRMGRDKGLINYHGKPQREYLYDLLEYFCDNVYFSCRPEQVESLKGFKTIPDTFHDLGPFGGILSAFRQNPNAAWLVVACDLPLLDEEAIQELIDNQNHSKNATAFYNEITDFPEPLITIWQPRSYPVLLQYLAQGYSCPRKVLINSEIELVQPSRPKVLKNVNHPQEADDVMEFLDGQRKG
ncbi:MAG: NTP transferase domain-containing protein [Saprospiraceae bacterium]